MSHENPEYVFVYGTLMTPFKVHQELLGRYVTKIEEATTEGILYHLPEGYPALVEGPGKVLGQLLTVPLLQEILPDLDEYEGYYGPESTNNEYRRVLKDVYFKEAGQVKLAYCYIYARKDYLAKGLLVENGDWLDFNNR